MKNLVPPHQLKSAGIYIIHNADYSALYIGRASRFIDRYNNYRQEYSQLANNIKRGRAATINKKFHDYLCQNENAWDELVFEPLCYCEKDELPDNEQKYIDLYDAVKKGFNVVPYSIIHGRSYRDKEEIVSKFLGFRGVNRSYVSEKLYGNSKSSSLEKIHNKLNGFNGQSFTVEEFDKIIEIRKKMVEMITKFQVEELE